MKGGQSDIFRPYEPPENPTTSAYFFPTVSTVTEGPEDMALHGHIESHTYVTGCLFCGKPFKQVIEEAVADYLHQTAEPRETVRDTILERKAIIDGLQSGVFISIPRVVSKAATCDGKLNTVNFPNPQPGTQTRLLTLFEVEKHYKIQLNLNPGQMQSPPLEGDTTFTYINLRVFI